MPSFRALRSPHPGVAAVFVAAALSLAGAGVSHAGANIGARAQLSYSRDSLSVAPRDIAPGILRLYVWLDGARHLKGAEYTVRWHVVGGDSLLSVLGEKHPSGDDCGDYLMRGHSIQVPEANAVNAWGVAFASDESDSLCHSGPLAEITFDASALRGQPVAFALTDVKLLDDNSEADPIVTVGPLRGNGTSAPSPAEAPLVLEVEPRGLRTAGGAALELRGERFVAGSRVFLENTEATDVRVVDPKHITFTAPAHAAGTIAARVVNPNGLSGWLPGAVVYTDAPAPRIQDVLPDTIGIYRPFTIRGSGFTQGTRVRIGGVLATDVHYVTSSLLTAIVPLRRAGDAAIEVENPDGLRDQWARTVHLLASSSGQ